MRKWDLRALTCVLILAAVSAVHAASPPPPSGGTTSQLLPTPTSTGETTILASPNTVAGYTPAQFSVSSGGAATYSIAIAVPPGVAGMQPNLALVYNSQAGNGLFGMGWNLSGLSSIARCARTKASDGVQGKISFDANDRYCLDGQRLVLISGTYGAAGSEYRTELESFSKIVAVGTAGNGPASFTVKTKSGLTLEYGNTSDSRIEAVKAAGTLASWPVGTVRTWALNKTTDAAGNFMTASYNENATTGEYSLARMDYAGNSVQLTATVAVVVGPSPPPVVATYYQAGAQFSVGLPISNVKTYAGATLVNDFQLAYQKSPTTGRNRLTSVTQCIATGKCLAPVTLGWQDFAAGVSSTASSDFNYPTAPMQVSLKGNLIDMGSDGLPDLVRTNPTSRAIVVNKNSGHGFDGGLQWTAPTNNSLANWSTFTEQIADLDGDGLPDYVRVQPSTGLVLVSKNQGNGFSVDTVWKAADGGVWSNGFNTNTIDINGDGLPDLIYTGISTGFVNVLINNGTGFNAPVVWSTVQVSSPQYIDVNGDGLPDLVSTNTTTNLVQASINNGAGFNAPVVWSTVQVSSPQYIDVNGDGLPDLMDGLQVSINNGAGFNAPNVWNIGSIYVADTARNIDINGDGLPDLIYTYSSNAVNVYLNQSSKPDLLTWISNGATLSISYLPLTNNGVYAKDTGFAAAVFPLRDVIAPLYVVSAVSRSNGIGGVNVANYTYGGLKAELGTGRGMLGFRWMSSKDVATGIESGTEFRQDYPYIGMAAKSVTSLAGAKLKTTTTTLECKTPLNAGTCVIPTRCDLAVNAAACAAASASRYVPVVVATEQAGWDLNGSAYPTTTTSSTYAVDPVDGKFYGDVAQSKSTTSDGASQTTDYLYWPADTANWIFGRPKQATVTSVKP